jgi:hypothetical protein
VNKKASRTSKAGNGNDVHMDIDSGDESDGRNAVREVEAKEELRVAHCDPGNASMQHFHKPMAIMDRSGQRHWEFQCHFCGWYVNAVYTEQ